jgi:hypothetical protein
MATPTLTTIKGLSAKYEWALEGGLRSLVFHRKDNGFDQCIIRIGRKILINEEAFFRWLDEKNGNKLNLSSQEQ